MLLFCHCLIVGFCKREKTYLYLVFLSENKTYYKAKLIFRKQIEIDENDLLVLNI